MTAIPGEPSGTPYDPGVTPHSETPYTPSSNFDSSTLESLQEIGGESNYLICDRTGFKIPVKTGLRREWNGWMVRPESWEPRHPLDFVRAKPERSRGSPRPEPEDTFLTTNEVTREDL